MADKVEFVITGRDQSAAALTSFRNNANAAFKSAGIASQQFGALLKGGGLLLGFRALATTLGDVAERFKSTNAAAAQFAKTTKTLSDSMDRNILFILERMAPAVKAVGDYFDPAARATKHLAQATKELAEAEAQLASARNNPRSGLNTVGGAGTTIADLEARVRQRGYAVTAARASAEASIKGPSMAGVFSDMREFDAAAAKDAETQAKATAERIAKYNEDLVKTRIDNEAAAEAELAERNEAIVLARAAREEAVFEAQKKVEKEAADDRLKSIKEQAEQFGETFAANLIQSGETGFKGLLEQWKNTLIQMVAAAQAQRLFESIFPQGFNSSAGGVIGGIAKVLGFADGGEFKVGGGFGRDANFVPLRLSRDEVVTVTPGGRGGAGGNVMVNQTISVGAGASRAEVMAAMAIAKNQAIYEIQNARGRGR